MTEPHSSSEPTKPGGRRRAEPKRAARPERASRVRGSRIKEPEAAAAPGLPPTSGLSEQQAADLRQALAGDVPRKRLRVPGTRGLVVVAVVAIALAFGIRALASGGDDDGAEDPAPAAAEPGKVNASFGNTWTTADGSSYEISVQPLSDLVQGQSASGCLQVPPMGSANLHFRILITNTSAEEAPVPRIDLGTDLARGKVDPGKQTYATSNKNLVVEPPPAGAQNCEALAELGPQGRDPIPAGGVLELTGTFGPIDVPIKDAPTVVYRYHSGDGAEPTELLAPFKRF